jgi:hypothetical protein
VRPTWRRYPARLGLGAIATALVADRGWKRRFQEPVPLLRGHQLVTRNDAGWRAGSLGRLGACRSYVVSADDVQNPNQPNGGG